MTRRLVALVMAGGTGTRLYPASRSHRPKQFCSFASEDSLLTQTVERMAFADEVLISTRAAFADRIEAHAPDANVIVDPVAKDTGPALVYAAHHARERYDDPVLLCAPSDHWISGEFAAAARAAAHAARETNGLVTLGVEPTRPATEYGYIVPGPEDDPARPVERFHEKPGPATASDLIADGCYWNAGIFAWTPTALLREARASPLASLVDGLDRGTPQAAFASIDPISIDYAILERTDAAYVVPASFDWDDLGTWDAIGRRTAAPLSDALEIDATGNVIASDDTHVTAIGVSGLVIAAYDDRVLVVPTDEAHRVRTAVSSLKKDDLF